MNEWMAEATAKAAVLVEALPWMQRFAGRTVVVKYGGAAMTSPELRSSFASDIIFLKYAGLKPVVVHGGGPQIARMLDRLGIESHFVAGLRVTSSEAMQVVRMVLHGQVNRDLVNLLNEYGPYAVGLTGEDAGLMLAHRTGAVVDGEPVDIGLVGDVEHVRPAIIHATLEDGRIPVIATIAPDGAGVAHNINADTAAAAIATALHAEKMVMLTDVPGLYADWPSSEQVVEQIDAAALRELLPTLDKGMRPKMQACLRAVDGGVSRATVLDGRVPHALLLEIFTDRGVGTQVMPS